MWAKVDDGWWCHPKVMGLSMAARGLWVSALSWSCAQRLDEVPVTLLAMVQATGDQASELVDAGLWVPIEGGWRIHDWHEYQDLSTSEKRAIAGRKGGRRSGQSRRNETKQNEANTAPDQGKRRSKTKQNGFASEANDEAGTHPVPSLPDPSPPPESQSDLPPAAEPVVTVVDDQQIRRTASLVGKALAVGADNPGAYAAAATKRILTGDDPTDRDEIRQALVDGRSPEAIAEAWDPGPASDPFGIAAPRQPRQPSATELEAIRQRAHARIADDRARIDETMTTERAPAAAVAEIIGATRAKRRGGAV